MTFLPSLAFKNLFRYARRTIITSSAIAMGIFMFIMMDSMLKGANNDSERNLIWYETGSAAIVHPEYWEDQELLPLDRPVEDVEGILEELAAQDIPATPRIDFGADLIIYQDPFPEYGNLPVRMTAIDMETDSDVFKLNENLSEGRFPEPDEYGLVIGQWLANDLGAEVGFPVMIMTRTMDGYYQTMDLEITGILLSDNPMVNRYGMYMPLSTAQDALEMNGYATAVYTSLPRGRREAAELAGMTPVAEKRGYEVIDWRLMGKDFVDLAAAKAQGSQTILFLVFLVAAVGISNTILMSIFERVRELGMMRAMGMRDRQIRRMFLMEASGIGFFGSLFGVILGVIGNIFMVNKGLDFTSMLESGDMGYRISGIMYGVWDPSTFITAFVVGLLMAVLVAWLPTRRALKLEIPVCLRYI